MGVMGGERPIDYRQRIKETHGTVPGLQMVGGEIVDGDRDLLRGLMSQVLQGLESKADTDRQRTREEKRGRSDQGRRRKKKKRNMGRHDLPL